VTGLFVRKLVRREAFEKHRQSFSIHFKNFQC